MKKVKIPHMIMKIFWLVSLAKGAEITWAEPSSISKWYYRKASSLVLYIGTDTISITISPPPTAGVTAAATPNGAPRASDFNASSWCSRGVDGAPPGRSVMATIL
jgi:hypothetical protein